MSAWKESMYIASDTGCRSLAFATSTTRSESRSSVLGAGAGSSPSATSSPFAAPAPREAPDLSSSSRHDRSLAQLAARCLTTSQTAVAMCLGQDALASPRIVPTANESTAFRWLGCRPSAPGGRDSIAASARSASASSEAYVSFTP